MKKCFTFLLFLAMLSCQKQEAVTDPPVVEPQFKLLTSRDNKGMAAKVNSQVWYSQTAAGTDYYAVQGGINPTELTLIATGGLDGQAASRANRITIFINSVSAVGTYNLGGTSSSYAVYTTLATDGSLLNYKTDASRTGTVQVTTYDTQKKIISGFFSFQATTTAGTVEVKEGEFQNVPLSK